MTRENPLTHHEKLRYDYLLKNIHYLNEKEKREFAFLQAKLEGQKDSAEVFNPEAKEQLLSDSGIDLPTYANRSHSSRRSSGDQLETKIPKAKKQKKKRGFRFKRLFAWLGMILLCVAV